MVQPLLPLPWVTVAVQLFTDLCLGWEVTEAPCLAHSHDSCATRWLCKGHVLSPTALFLVSCSPASRLHVSPLQLSRSRSGHSQEGAQRPQAGKAAQRELRQSPSSPGQDAVCSWRGQGLA